MVLLKLIVSAQVVALVANGSVVQTNIAIQVHPTATLPVGVIAVPKLAIAMVITTLLEVVVTVVMITVLLQLIVSAPVIALQGNTIALERQYIDVMHPPPLEEVLRESWVVVMVVITTVQRLIVSVPAPEL